MCYQLILKMRNSWNLKLSKVVILFLATTPFFVKAQFSKPVEKFPAEERYLYPVYPGQPGSLAGTMGELRTCLSRYSNHMEAMICHVDNLDTIQ